MIVMPPAFNAGDTIYFPFDTYDSNGASVTITGLAVTDIEVYKNGSVTQRSSDNGYTLLDTDGIDFDGSTGLHGFSIDTSDNSDAGFWVDGAQYWVHINAITVDGQTVRFTYFLALGYLLRPVTAGRELGVESDGDLTKVNTLDGHTAQTGDNYARLGAPAGASHAADVAAIKSDSAAILLDTNELQTDDVPGLIAALNDPTAAAIADAVLDELLSGHATAGSLGKAISDVLADTNELQTDWVNGGRLDLLIDSIISSIAALNDLDAAGVRSALGMASADLDTQLAVLKVLAIQRTTIATLASQTSFTLTAGSADDDAYNDCLIVIQDSATEAQKAIGQISDYTGSTKTVTLKRDPGVFTMAVGDTVTIVPIAQYVSQLAEADIYVDTTVTPWALVWMLAGSGGIGVGTELLRKQVKDTGGTNITATSSIVGQLVT